MKPEQALIAMTGCFLAICNISVGRADNYPVAGAWAYVDSRNPDLAKKACQAFDQLGRSKLSGETIGGGEMIVFEGSKRYNFGGYADDETPNISVRKLSPNSFEIVDRWISDGEGGQKPGPHKKRYVLKLIEANAIEIKQGPYPSTKYVRCTGQKPSESGYPDVQSLLRAANLNLPKAVAGAIAEARDDCSFKSIPPNSIRTLDLNGDGVSDYVIDYGELGCRAFCGSAGCLHEIWVSQDGQFIRSLSRNVQAIERIEPRNPGNDRVVASTVRLATKQARSLVEFAYTGSGQKLSSNDSRNSQRGCTMS